VFASVFLEAGRIEAGLAARAVAAMQGPGLYWFAVEPNGRQLIVSGGASDAAAVAAAAAQLAEVSGASEIVNRIAVIGAAGACQQRLDEARAARPVTFRKGNDELAPASDPVLATLAGVLQQCGARIEIAVHAEGGGSAALGLALSQRRADQIARRLVAHGVGVEQVIATGYGITQPAAAAMQARAASNGANGAVGRPIDQRVEFRVLGAAT